MVTAIPLHYSSKVPTGNAPGADPAVGANRTQKYLVPMEEGKHTDTYRGRTKLIIPLSEAGVTKVTLTFANKLKQSVVVVLPKASKAGLTASVKFNLTPSGLDLRVKCIRPGDADVRAYSKKAESSDSEIDLTQSDAAITASGAKINDYADKTEADKKAAAEKYGSGIEGYGIRKAPEELDVLLDRLTQHLQSTVDSAKSLAKNMKWGRDTSSADVEKFLTPDAENVAKNADAANSDTPKLLRSVLRKIAALNIALNSAVKSMKCEEHFNKIAEMARVLSGKPANLANSMLPLVDAGAEKLPESFGEVASAAKNFSGKALLFSHAAFENPLQAQVLAMDTGFSADHKKAFLGNANQEKAIETLFDQTDGAHASEETQKLRQDILDAVKLSSPSAALADLSKMAVSLTTGESWRLNNRAKMTEETDAGKVQFEEVTEKFEGKEKKTARIGSEEDLVKLMKNEFVKRGAAEKKIFVDDASGTDYTDEVIKAVAAQACQDKNIPKETNANGKQQID